jgi:uncharacterized GH25 family protein
MKRKLTLALVGLAVLFWGSLFLGTEARSHSLWLETESAKVPANQPLKVNVGFNEGFEVVDILEEGIPNISAPIILGPDGEFTAKLAGGKNYE